MFIYISISGRESENISPDNLEISLVDIIAEMTKNRQIPPNADEINLTLNIGKANVVTTPRSTVPKHLQKSLSYPQFTSTKTTSTPRSTDTTTTSHSVEKVTNEFDDVEQVMKKEPYFLLNEIDNVKHHQKIDIKSSLVTNSSPVIKSSPVTKNNETVKHKGIKQRNSSKEIIDILTCTDKTLTVKLDELDYNDCGDASLVQFKMKPKKVESKPSGFVKKVVISENVKLRVGNMVAMNVSPEHHIPGQPCIGEIQSLPDNKDYAVIHFYTGTYDRPWVPMMARQNAYLREVKKSDIFYSFQLDSENCLPRHVVSVLKN